MDPHKGSDSPEQRPEQPQIEAGEVTRLLCRMASGDKLAEQELFELIFAELKRLAASKLRRERPGHTLQPTALVNEAYMKIMQNGPVEVNSRGHFMALAAQAMRRILADHGRAHKAKKRGAFSNAISLEAAVGTTATMQVDLSDLDDALTRLATFDPVAAKVVEMQYFGGLTQEAIAKIMGRSSRTVKRKWAIAQAWLRQDLDP